jgi:apolipoprotein N-acyltransferase
VVFFRRNFFFLSVLTSLLLWASFPGGGAVWPLLFVALIPLLFVIYHVNARGAAFWGLICGLVHFTLLLYWIVIVLGKYGGLAWFISLPALLLLALYMSLYFVLFALLSRYILLAFPPAVSLWLLPSLWVGIDWSRGVFLTGFPWMDLGYALYKVPFLIQIADLAGHHGVTFLIIFVNTCLMLIVTKKHSVSGYLVILVPTLCLLVGIGIYSKNRFEEVQHEMSAHDASWITVGIVQGNVDQSVKWSPSQQQRTVDNYLSQTKSLFGSGRPSLVVWPETALPFYPPSNGYMEPLKQLVATNDFALLTGAPWYEIIDRNAKKVNFFNSAILLQPDGMLGGKYYKTHLVPFGEYVPLKKFLPFLAPLVEAVGDFSSGKIERPLVWQEAKVGVLICFESVFPEISREWVLAGANVLVNLTNDAWYGKSSAPHQSLAMSVLRAVETRRSLVRSANTGISAFITPAGTITKQSELFVPWAAAKKVVLLEQVTVWARYGYLFAPICLAIGLLGGLAAGSRRRWL